MVQEMTIGQARDGFSALISALASGLASEFIIKKRDTPVARVVPIRESAKPARQFGIASGNPFLLDDEAFDAMDAEIANEMGA